MSNELTPHEPPSLLGDLLQKLNLPELIAGPAGKAISRLIAGAADIPAAYLESFAQSIKNKTEAKQLVSKEVAAAASKLAASDHNIIARAAHNLLAKEHRHQRNKEEIARKTIDILEQDPVQPSQPGAKNQNSQPAPDVDEEWLNVFEKHAADASTERMQTLWARVLAGEIRQPKTFSLRSLRFVAELDQDTAKLFEKYVPFICGTFIPTPGGLSGPSLIELVQLQNDDLLSGVGGFISQNFELEDSGRVAFQNQGYFLVVTGPPKHKLQFPVVMLTKIATEIYPILKVPFDMKAAEAIVERIPKDKLTSIELALGGRNSDGSFRIHPINKLWAAPAST